LSVAQGAVVTELRRILLLPLDDLLAVVRECERGMFAVTKNHPASICQRMWSSCPVRGVDVLLAFRKKLSRPQFARFMTEHPPCAAALEACPSAHHLVGN